MPTILDFIQDHEESLRLVAPKKKPAIIKCKFCDWQVQKWKTTKKRKKVQLYSALEHHVMMEHPDEWEKIEELP